MEYHELNISTSTITKEIMAALEMHYAAPGQPSDPNGFNILKAFGALAGVLAELAAATHRADSDSFRKAQPMFTHCCTQLAHIVSSPNPGRTMQIFLVSGLSVDGRIHEPKAPASPTVPS